MRSYIIVALVTTLFAVSASAFAFPEAVSQSSGTTCETECNVPYKIAAGCSYAPSDTLSSSELKCICENKSFPPEFKKCVECMESAKLITSAQHDEYLNNIDRACPASSGAGGLSPVRASELITGMAAAGFVLYGF